jgi:hypothetical protein
MSGAISDLVHIGILIRKAFQHSLYGWHVMTVTLLKHIQRTERQCPFRIFGVRACAWLLIFVADSINI